MLVHSMCQPGRARPPGALPRWLAGTGALPEGEVHGVFLVLVDLNAAARLHALQGAVAELAVALALLHAEENVPPGGVGVAGTHQPADCLDDGTDLLRGPRVDVGASDVQRVHGPEEIVDVPFCQFRRLDALLLGPLDDLVVDVGEILDMANVVSEVFQVPSQDVEGDVAEGVADVGG